MSGVKKRFCNIFVTIHHTITITITEIVALASARGLFIFVASTKVRNKIYNICRYIFVTLTKVLNKTYNIYCYIFVNFIILHFFVNF